ncbi:hypothetical protein HZH68_006953 [Vespula germanica]|uniref:Uncharacterized protein n=1 Tax=Vespula germanica TaxID=30212 RepID=A0A834NBA7_VESGE|nr:hypothetical protein HZH68_006953 [Vespula germanica]
MRLRNLGTDLRIAQLSNTGSFDHHLSTTDCASRQTPEPNIESYRTHRYLGEYSGNTHAITQNGTRSYTNRKSNMFEKFQEEKLQYRHEKNYYEQVEGKNSWDRSLRDATELHDVQPEGCRILQIMKED